MWLMWLYFEYLNTFYCPYLGYNDNGVDIMLNYRGCRYVSSITLFDPPRCLIVHWGSYLSMISYNSTACHKLTVITWRSRRNLTLFSWLEMSSYGVLLSCVKGRSSKGNTNWSKVIFYFCWKSALSFGPTRLWLNKGFFAIDSKKIK